jgi:hypothetical protein
MPPHEYMQQAGMQCWQAWSGLAAKHPGQTPATAVARAPAAHRNSCIASCPGTGSRAHLNPHGTNWSPAHPQGGGRQHWAPSHPCRVTASRPITSPPASPPGLSAPAGRPTAPAASWYQGRERSPGLMSWKCGLLAHSLSSRSQTSRPSRPRHPAGGLPPTPTPGQSTRSPTRPGSRSMPAGSLHTASTVSRSVPT